MPASPISAEVLTSLVEEFKVEKITYMHSKKKA